MKISIPQEPDEYPLTGDLVRKHGRFFFAFDNGGGHPMPIGATSWEDAAQEVRTILYFFRARQGIADLPPHLSHLKNVEIQWHMADSYDEKTRNLVAEAMFYSAMLCVNRCYHAAKKQKQSGTCISRAAGGAPFMTVDGLPLTTVIFIETTWDGAKGTIDSVRLFAGPPESIKFVIDNNGETARR